MHEVALLDDNGMKMVLGGSGAGGEECAYIQCGCTHGVSFNSGTPDRGATWREDCNYNMILSGSLFNNHCEKGEGYCYRVYKK